MQAFLLNFPKKSKNFPVLQVQKVCNLFALGQKQAIFPGDGLSQHHTDEVNHHTNQDRTAAKQNAKLRALITFLPMSWSVGSRKNCAGSLRKTVLRN